MKLRLQETRFLKRRDYLQMRSVPSGEGRIRKWKADKLRWTRRQLPRASPSPDSRDSEHLGFFFHVVEHLEASAEKALALVEEKSRELLGQSASNVFSHLLRLDPDFDFASVLGPVPETIHAALAKWVVV
ncbi:hypothetical protein D1007_40548 [Hordeum vulgare]|nr:hypothetical protein D1007_40548 [Hordeum vulgare]